MKRLEQVFADRNHKALIAYLTVGYPDLAATLELVPLLAEAGCDVVELGIPFSDPLADGTTIQTASHRALQNGITPQRCLEIAAVLRRKVDIPLLFMTYYNPVLHYGVERFCGECRQAGVAGLIVPDLPPEEGGVLGKAADESSLSLIYLLAPTSPVERVRLVTKKSRGFIYLVSLTGVTGARGSLPAGLEEFVDRVRRETDKPLCVGFGIATPGQAQRVSRVADGVIVGSRLLQVVGEDASPYRRTGEFLKSLRHALDAP